MALLCVAGAEAGLATQEPATHIGGISAFVLQIAVVFKRQGIG